MTHEEAGLSLKETCLFFVPHFAFVALHLSAEEPVRQPAKHGDRVPGRETLQRPGQELRFVVADPEQPRFALTTYYPSNGAATQAMEDQVLWCDLKPRAGCGIQSHRLPALFQERIHRRDQGGADRITCVPDRGRWRQRVEGRHSNSPHRI